MMIFFAVLIILNVLNALLFASEYVRGNDNRIARAAMLIELLTACANAVICLLFVRLGTV